MSGVTARADTIAPTVALERELRSHSGICERSVSAADASAVDRAHGATARTLRLAETFDALTAGAIAARGRARTLEVRRALRAAADRHLAVWARWRAPIVALALHAAPIVEVAGQAQSGRARLGGATPEHAAARDRVARAAIAAVAGRTAFDASMNRNIAPRGGSAAVEIVVALHACGRHDVATKAPGRALRVVATAAYGATPRRVSVGARVVVGGGLGRRFGRARFAHLVVEAKLAVARDGPERRCHSDGEADDRDDQAARAKAQRFASASARAKPFG